MYYFNYYKYNANLPFVKRRQEKNEKIFKKFKHQKIRATGGFLLRRRVFCLPDGTWKVKRSRNRSCTP